MNQDFEVSVIMPVYNAEKFVARSIQSALDQPEVKEVIVIDDGYPDNSFNICSEISKNDFRVRLMSHPERENKGAGASRNLGIINARYPFLAFLDADDYYLPNRFSLTKQLFASNQGISVAYEPVGTVFASNEARLRFAKMMKIDEGDVDQFTTFPNEFLEGRAMFESLLLLTNGLPPHTDGITIKKSLIPIVGLFNPRLKLHQDSEYWIRLAYDGYFATPLSRIPVSMREMHDENRVYKKNNLSKLIYYRSLLAWATQVELPVNLYQRILNTHNQLAKSLNS